MGKISRRRFLESGGAAASAAAGAALLTIVPRHVLGRGQTPPSDKLAIAGIASRR